ncbi:MAG TPA: recombinase RecT [Trueperaceae bacterium]|nr:recombinase RecT [Trueperaceae bacterium]
MSGDVTKSNGTPGQALAKPKATLSERFLADVERQFLAEMGRGTQFTALEQRLVQHMYLSVDQALKAAEEKRTKGWTEEKLATAADDPRAFTWHHVDRQKLALDTVHRVSLGLDALIPNHIWPIAYFNSAKGLYDIDLRVGYIGRDYVTRRFAMDTPIDIAYELVYSTDTFKALPRSSSREVEGYEFEITNPFNRGDIVGGFGYIVYDDPRKNRLVLVTKRDFDRARAASKSDFWTKNDVEMHLKTVYHRVVGKMTLDPAKVNVEVLASVLEDDRDVVDVAHVEVEVAHRNVANRQLVDVQPATVDVESAGEAAEPESLFAEATPGF